MLNEIRRIWQKRRKTIILPLSYNRALSSILFSVSFPTSSKSFVIVWHHLAVSSPCPWPDFICFILSISHFIWTQPDLLFYARCSLCHPFSPSQPILNPWDESHLHPPFSLFPKAWSSGLASPHFISLQLEPTMRSSSRLMRRLLRPIPQHQEIKNLLANFCCLEISASSEFFCSGYIKTSLSYMFSFSNFHIPRLTLCIRWLCSFHTLSYWACFSFSIPFPQLRLTFSPNSFYVSFISKPFSIITYFIQFYSITIPVISLWSQLLSACIWYQSTFTFIHPIWVILSIHISTPCTYSITTFCSDQSDSPSH